MLWQPDRGCVGVEAETIVQSVLQYQSISAEIPSAPLTNYEPLRNQRHGKRADQGESPVT